MTARGRRFGCESWRRTGGWVNEVPFSEGGPNGIEGNISGVGSKLVKRAHDGAIEIPPQQILATRVFREFHPCLFRHLHQAVVRVAHYRDEPAVEKIQAEREIDDGADNGRMCNPLTAGPRAVHQLDGIVVGALSVRLPEVRAFAEPVPFIVTASDDVLTGEDAFGDRPIAAVVTKDKMSGSRVHGSAKPFGEADSRRR